MTDTYAYVVFMESTIFKVYFVRNNNKKSKKCYNYYIKNQIPIN